MKKIIPFLLFFVWSQIAFSQYCGYSGPGACSPPPGSPTIPGFYPPGTGAYLVNGFGNPLDIGFKNWTRYYYAAYGDTVTVDSLVITGITGLPPNVCWVTNNTNNIFTPGEYGAFGFLVTGSVCVPPGQYYIGVQATIYQVTQPIYAHIHITIPYYIQVVNAGEPPVATNPNQGIQDPYLPNGFPGSCNGNGLKVSLGPDVSLAQYSIITFDPLVTGGTPPYTYNWNSLSGDSLSCYNCRYPNVDITKTDTFIVTVTDNNHNQAKDTIIYKSSVWDNIFPCSLVFSVSNNGCTQGIDTTTIMLDGNTVDNNTRPYSINWGNGVSTTNSNSMFSGVYTQRGAYVITVYDAEGCVYSLIDTISYLGVDVSVQPITSPNCNGYTTGEIVANASGVPNAYLPYYTYAWSNGATTDTISNLAPGNYTVTATYFGCSASSTYNLNALYDYYVFLQETDANCIPNGTIQSSTYGGMAPYTYLWSNASTTANLTSLSTGNYTVTVSDSIGCQTLGHISVGSACQSVITGIVYYTLGNTCNPDTTRPVGAGMGITASTLSQHGYYGFTDSNGFYTILIPDTGMFYVSPISYPGGACGANNCAMLDVADIHALGDSSNNNIIAVPLTFSGSFDLGIHPGWSSAAPGFVKEYWIYYYNSESMPYIGPSTVTFNYDSNLVYQYSVGPQPTVNLATHTLVWQFDTIPLLINRAILPCYFQIPSTLSPGYYLQSDFSIAPIAGDCDPSDNHLQFSDLVSGSHDPNEKDVVPANSINIGDSVLTYTIHFQNDGTDSTHFIIIKDTLSPYLNAGTVQNIASSASFSNFTITGSGILTWTFNPYRLPGNTVDAYGSRGFITFSVNKNANTPVGTVINNTASVYFDYNAPVITNTVSNTVVNPTGITPLISTDNNITVTAYPNPFHDFTNIVVNGLNQKFDFELYDITGRMIKQIPSINTSQFQLENNGMAAGIYMYRIAVNNESGNGTSNVAYGKIIVE